jgi:hypothetical protein
MAEGTGRGEMLSIWFFVGGLMLIYGVVLTPYGAWAWLTHSEAPTVLNNLHPTFWWGLLMTVFGLFYTIKFRPRSGDVNKA